MGRNRDTLKARILVFGNFLRKQRQARDVGDVASPGERSSGRGEEGKGAGRKRRLCNFIQEDLGLWRAFLVVEGATRGYH